MPPLRPHPHLYEINTWAWLEELSRTAGRRLTLADVPGEEWDRLRALGFDLVYLLGVWQRSPAARQWARSTPEYFSSYDAALPGWTLDDVVGSGFAVRDYEPDPRLLREKHTWRDIDNLRTHLHQRGMGLVLDFVGNHTALDHPWMTAHPEFYIQGTMELFRREPSAFYCAEPTTGPPLLIARGRDPNYPAWPDTAQLNYFQPATRAAMIAILRLLQQHCDGVRCDMAMLALNDVFARIWGNPAGTPPATEFWSEARAAVPDLLLLGEVYWKLEGRLQQLGVNFTYDKGLYDRLRFSNAQDVGAHIAAADGDPGRMGRFIENHDEPRAVTAFGVEKSKAAAVAVATLPGLRFFHQGQLEGRTRFLPMQMGRAAAEPMNEDVRSFYRRLLAIANQPAFHEGEWKLLAVTADTDASYPSLLAWRWKLDHEFKLVVVNLGDQTAQGRVPLAGEVDAAKQYSLADELNGPTYVRDGREITSQGLFVRLEPYGAHVLALEP